MSKIEESQVANSNRSNELEDSHMTFQAEQIAYHQFPEVEKFRQLKR